MTRKTAPRKKSPAPPREAGHSASAQHPPASKPYLPGKAKTPRRPDGKFAKGYQPSKGRAKGQRNRTTVMLKDAVLKAATLIGQDGKGKNGLTGYLMMLAVKERAVYARLLEKVLPMQLELKDKTAPQYTAEEAVARLRERGLPVPNSLLALVGPQEGVAAIAHSLNDAREDGITDHLDGRAEPARTMRFTQDEDDEFDIDVDADEDEEG
jgi:hypothetical protein